MLPSLQEIRDYLDAQNLKEKCQTPNDSVFLHFVDGRQLDAQNSYGTLPVDARFWIKYETDLNEFILNVNFFTHDGTGISREQFGESVAANNPAILYTSDIAVKWIVSESNVYTISCPVDVGISRYFNIHIPTITKII